VRIRAVVFDVGETIIDETRAWSDWADWLGIPRLTFLAAVGAAIARGATDHRAPFYLFRPGIDLAGERRLREASGRSDDLRRDDLYPDAEACLETLAAAGYRLAIVGNQPSRTEALLRELGVPLAFAASSESWGVAKPDPAFFARIVDELGLPAAAIAYVGDRLDNDVRPAAAAGLQAVFIRRGPWAWIQAGRTDPPEAALVVESLAALPGALATLAPD
jgi:FMN phosphatase YigB (HAD superfamily)